MRRPVDTTRPMRRPDNGWSGGDSRPSDPVRNDIQETEYRRIVEIAMQDDCERQKGIRLQKVITGNPDKPYIALTFDDGPHGSRTTKLLDRLSELQVPATFFLVGTEVEKYPDIVTRMVIEKHELGNHTYHHYRLPSIPLSNVADELNRMNRLLVNVVGRGTRLVRPPGGEYNAAVQRVIEQNGYVTVLWTDDPADYAFGRTPAQVEGFIERDITPGGIILLHDGVQATYDALPRMVRRLRKQGYVFVTVSQLIQNGGGLARLQEFKVSRTGAIPLR